MGRISKLLEFIRLIRNGSNVSDVKINPGGGANNTAEHFSPPGDDSFPLKTDYVFTVENGREGGETVVAYNDPVNTPVAVEGDKRIYGRSSNGGNVNQVWLKNDGSILISNNSGSILLRSDGGSIVTTPNSTFDIKADGSIKGDNTIGSFELQAGGDFLVNQVTIDVNGNITTAGVITGGSAVLLTSLTVSNQEMKDHTHSQGSDSGGNTEQNTGGPI